jgi:hypothetical protein
VVAVAGFYFGTSATAAGASAAAAAQPVVIRSTSPLPAARINQTYPGAQLQAVGGTPPYMWTVTTGALPAGLELDSTTGRITGTPTAAGEPFTVQVEDKSNATASKQFEVPIT